MTKTEIRMKPEVRMTMRSIAVAAVAAMLSGCASQPTPPRDATLLASGLKGGEVVTIPTGTKKVYMLQHSTSLLGGAGFMSFDLADATTQPTTLPVPTKAMAGLSDPSKPYDVYVSDK